jgi:exodeoxyribonuclease VII small subunit
MTKKKKSEHEVPENLDFEAAMEQLQALVTAVESGELPLQEALNSFEKGSLLARHMRKILEDAEQRVEELSGAE